LHYECGGITASEAQLLKQDWQCMNCFIQRMQKVKTLRHIPKGARIQVAQALAQCIEDCVSTE